MIKYKDFEYIKICMASPDDILNWSMGEVVNQETLNYKTQKPEFGGLFCERIFGPLKDYECSCGKYKNSKYFGIVCDKCGVEITKSSVRRYRIGHIKLAVPVVHIWYLKNLPSKISIILDIPLKSLEKIIYYMYYIVIDPGTTDLKYKQLLTDVQKQEYENKYGENSFKASIGAEAIKYLLSSIDLQKEFDETNKLLLDKFSDKQKLIKKNKILKSLLDNNQRPEWMVLDVLPVMPPEYRPIVKLDTGKFASSDLNDLYRRIINRNNRLKKLLNYNAPEIIIKNEKRMLQEAVDMLIDNTKNQRSTVGAGQKEIRSISTILRGKQGRFRQNLLGKRVDFSGRSVIVVGPNLSIDQCGLPKEIAAELFKPYIIRYLIEHDECKNIRSAKNYITFNKPKVYKILESIIPNYYVLLNRAPTLHRLSIQAFKPILIDSKAIELHPLVCGAFNADFDGDQMAVHLPLSVQAQEEARVLMASTNNILKPADGKPIMSPTQDMVLGIYYLTLKRREIGKKYNDNYEECENGIEYNPIKEMRIYKSEEDALLHYQAGNLFMQDEIIIMRTVHIGDKTITGKIKTTVGLITFNEIIPQDLGIVKRLKDEDYLKYEIDYVVKKKDLKIIIDKCYKKFGSQRVIQLLDDIKRIGFRYSTMSAISISVFDMIVPKNKEAIIQDADKQIEQINDYYYNGYITNDERYKNTINVWKQATDDVANELIHKTLKKFNTIKMIVDSGARGSDAQIKQLSGMRGVVQDTNGNILEVPIKSNYKEGLDAFEYFISSHGGRKGLADTALKTSDSGYLTRRLVDVSQEVVIREDDCFKNANMSINGITVSDLICNDDMIEPLKERIIGRYTAEKVINENTKEIILNENEFITEEKASIIKKSNIKFIKIRSPLTCVSKIGICAKCYGMDMAHGGDVKIGEAVGIIAAQSIGEPGTQLTMRNFHLGGIAGSSDITQGLPKIEELFEARMPKYKAVLSEIDGIVEISNNARQQKVINIKNDNHVKSYNIPVWATIIVKNNESVKECQQLTNGVIYAGDILNIKGLNAAVDFLLGEVQNVYKLQGIDINDKHVEIIIKQMMQTVQIVDCGDSKLINGEKILANEFNDIVNNLISQNLRPPKAKQILVGITKASLMKDSFLAAASFQETTKVLTNAAILNKIDKLIGLKENIILGKLIPAGTGLIDK